MIFAIEFHDSSVRHISAEVFEVQDKVATFYEDASDFRQHLPIAIFIDVKNVYKSDAMVKFPLVTTGVPPC